MVLATVVAAQGALGEIYRRSRNGEPTGAALPLAFWIAQGLGILVKGPVTPLVSVLAAGALALADRNARWLGRLHFFWGVPLALLIAAPWLIAIMVATDGGFAREALGNDLLGKLIHGRESHGAPPGTYLVAALLTFWPGSLALAGAARLAWRERAEPAIGFLIAWIVPFWLLMELVPTKLPHYVLPAYPALALLAGRALADGSWRGRFGDWRRSGSAARSWLCRSGSRERCRSRAPPLSFSRLRSRARRCSVCGAASSGRGLGSPRRRCCGRAASP